jgi:lipopolysaccharide assembly protein A
MNVKLIVGTILAGLAVIFIIQNTTVTDLRFFFWTLSMSRALLMLLIFSVGTILGWLLHGSFNRRNKNTTRAKQDVLTGRTIA